MPRDTEKNFNDELQTELADQYHTCTCGDDLTSWRGSYVPGTTKVLLANLKDSEMEAPKGRFVFYKTKCGKCGKQVMHGESCADYRATGERLLMQVAEKVARRLEVSTSEAKRLLNPSIKRFGLKKESRQPA